MSIKKQFATLRDNWLMIVLGIVVLVFISGGNGVVNQSFDSMKNLGGASFERGYDGMIDSEMMDYYPGASVSGDFAPEIEERKITKTSSLSTEIKRGEFGAAEEKLKNIVTSSGAYLLNERVNRNGEGWKGYFYGSYSLKVDTNKYDSVVAQLKEIGEVQDFNENALDVTGRYENLEVEIGVERTRLARYMEMYTNAKDVKDQIDLNDRIFDQERRIKYLENSLENLDNRIEYSSISFSMTEERSEWTDIALVKLSELVRGFVDSLNVLLHFVFGVIPWVIVGALSWLVWKKIRSD
ncbi:DUF4349 domain-containing protein [Candidatus Pacearchaeota archaeon]|nr:DUF4349 domain-containing protein [Candidatus Pacearchaeota archaeon]